MVIMRADERLRKGYEYLVSSAMLKCRCNAKNQCTEEVHSVAVAIFAEQRPQRVRAEKTAPGSERPRGLPAGPCD
jgi:hypothetical protein